MITVACLLWDGFGITSGGKEVKRDYTADTVNRFVRQMAERCSTPHRVVCITDQPEGIECETLPMPAGVNWPKAYRKLWLFSHEAAERMPGRVFYCDIDVEIVRDPAPLLACEGPLVVWQDPAEAQGRITSASYLLDTGSCPGIWEDFSFPDAMRDAWDWHTKTFGRMVGSDQAWMSYWLRNRSYETFPPGIYKARRIRSALPGDAMIVQFSGTLKPWHPAARRRFLWLGG